jgi:VWFA-related protein
MLTRVALVLALVTATTSFNQSQPPQPDKNQPAPQRPTFRTEANFVRVDVYPTRNGVPVPDLAAGDFRVLEDGVPQKVETFEFVQIRGSIPQEMRTEPNAIQQSRDAMRDPRARVFVLFLDVPHVRIHGSWAIREPLIRLIDRVLGPDDLVGIMTPTMSARDVVFARKTQVLAGGLRDRWPWGERFTLAEDEHDIMLKACYPWEATDALVSELKARRKERNTLVALQELVKWLRDEREERKAVLTISEGWLLYRPNPDLTRLRVIDAATGATEPVPGPDPIGVGPDGRLRMGAQNSTHDTRASECHAQRVALSLIDNDRFLRDIIDDANRANASFYTVDPRGLAAFDAPLGPEPPPPVSVDIRNLQNRLEALRTLASATDGLAAVNSNDLDKGLKRISDDLSSYYLLGYYSSNTKLDGRFRRLEVKVDRPGIDVRARRGYRAATVEEVTAARAAASAPVPESVTAARKALEALGRIRPSTPFRAHAIAVRGETPIAYVAGELTRPAPGELGAEITVLAGGTRTARTTIPAGGRGFVIAVPLAGPPSEPIDVRVRITSAAGDAPLTDMLRIDATEGLPHPLLFRRGPSTGNRLEPAGEPLFSRTERARFELPARSGLALTAGRVLDRNGTALELPVTVGERTDASGGRWLTADLTLAALGPGDYVVELSGTSAGAEQRVLTAIRVTR